MSTVTPPASAVAAAASTVTAPASTVTAPASTVTAPASTGEALGMLESAMGFLADADPAELPADSLAECLRGLERIDAIGAAVRGGFLAAFGARDGHLDDGQRALRPWLIHSLHVTPGQAGEYLALSRLAREQPRLLAGLREGGAFR